MKIKQIAIIGHFGGKENIFDGQTVKTRILYEELLNATDWRIQRVDTYSKSNAPIKFLWQSLTCLLSIKDVIVLLSGNGMKFYFPILCFFSKVLHTRVYHDVIGGNLDQYVEKYPKFKKYLNSFKINWVETASMKIKLEKVGVTNCEVMPNFKRLNIADVNSIAKEYNCSYRFCTFSRVMKEKGIEDAIDAVQAINEEFGNMICTLDIYGRIDDGYKGRFDEILKTVTSAVKYCGMVPFDRSVEAIKTYYALLFPTFWNGEGFPGTIVDSFSAGLPVIATDWNYNGEIVENKVDGILYPNNEIKTLQEAIKWAIENTGEVVEMKRNCIKKAKLFQPEEYIKKIIISVNQ